MFPTGTAGAALLVLRCTVAATVVANGTALWAPATAFWTFSGLSIVALLLSLGLLTPYGSAVACLIQLFLFFVSGPRNEFHLMTSALIAGVLAVLGPGAYSIDARIFGRRLLTLPSRR